MGVDTETIKAENSKAWRNWLSSLILLTVIGAAAVYFFGGPAKIASTITSSNPVSPTTLVDETLAVGAGGWQGRAFVLKTSGEVEISVEGQDNTAKGFTVYLLPASEVENFKAKREFTHIVSFQGLKTRSHKHKGNLPAGSYYLVVANTENWFNTLSTKVQVVAHP